MSNCIIAQSGGPSPVINATVAGIVKANQMNPVYEHVYGGLNGIEGMIMGRFTDLTDMTEEENRILCQTPGSVLGTCRYRLKKDNPGDFKRLFRTLEQYDIETVFYIGGKDSMATVAALAEYAEENNITGHRFIGCPKTIDNHIVMTDHCPGYPSAAKFIATTALQCWMDVNVYPASRKEVFIMETMGHEAGWLAASACLSGVVDVLIVPEVPFVKETVLDRVRECIARKNKCFVVISESTRNEAGIYVSALDPENHPGGYASLGGAGYALEKMILEECVSPRVKTMNLSNAQRCHTSEQSLVDVSEAFRLGMSAHMRSADPDFTGRMIGIRRRPDVSVYDAVFFDVAASEVAGHVRNFPEEWLLPEYRGVTDDFYDYLRPLIEGTPEIIMSEGLPAFIYPYYMR